MGRWYWGVPKNMTMSTANNMVLKEVARYVTANKKPDRRPDGAHEDLQTFLAKIPCDQAAPKLWGEHMQHKRHMEVMKKLRRFRKSAIWSTGTFFADLATWLVKPAHVSSMSPTLASATKKPPILREIRNGIQRRPSVCCPISVCQELPWVRPYQRGACSRKRAISPRNSRWGWTGSRCTQYAGYRRTCNGSYIEDPVRYGTRDRCRQNGPTPYYCCCTRRATPGGKQLPSYSDIHMHVPNYHEVDPEAHQETSHRSTIRAPSWRTKGTYHTVPGYKSVVVSAEHARSTGRGAPWISPKRIRAPPTHCCGLQCSRWGYQIATSP